MEMRVVFGSALANEMEIDKDIVVLDADLARANGTFALREKFPDRALDVGIAEQNMASIAAGLASYGFKPFISSFTPFATRRIADQIAVSIAYSELNVKIVGTDPGIAAELNGGTHMSMEDIGVLRSIPGLVIFEPVDEIQLKKAMTQVFDYVGPMYIRLFRKETPAVFNEDYEFNLHKADVVKEGKDVTIAASGIMVSEALKACEALNKMGTSAEVISIHTIKPIDAETLIASVKKTGCIVTCENHNVIGGLRSAVAEVLSENCPVPLRSVGVKDIFGQVGKIAQLKEFYEMTSEDIVKKVIEVIKLKK